METRVDEIELFVNGNRRLLAAVTVADVVRGESLHDARVATALNGQFIPAAARATTPVTVGDHVEIVSARAGG